MIRASQSRILLVHHEPAVRAAIAGALSDARHDCAQCDQAADAYLRLRRERFDVVVSGIDMPGINGIELLQLTEALRRRPEVVLVSGDAGAERVRRAFRQGAFDVLVTPWSIDDVCNSVAAALDLHETDGDHRPARSSRPFRDGCLESILTLVAAVEAKEPHMRAHAQTVSRYCHTLARRMGWPAKRIQTLRTAALLHDIGKIGVPDAVLRKPGPLTDEEFNLVKKHPATALRILRHSRFLNDELSYILHHHERYDGGGYPAGLAGDAIPNGARLLNVCDSLDAMLSSRSYKRGLSVRDAKAELERCAGKQFDPDAARAAVQWLEAEPHTFVTR